MALLETIADGLAQRALALSRELDDENVVEEVAKLIGTSSPTVEEAYRTAVRIRRAELRALDLMQRLKQKSDGSRISLSPAQPQAE